LECCCATVAELTGSSVFPFFQLLAGLDRGDELGFGNRRCLLGSDATGALRIRLLAGCVKVVFQAWHGLKPKHVFQIRQTDFR
jgi:hypothetical protein